MKKKVLLGMSGGTDSSVAAILLKEAGYDVTGVTFRFYEFNNSVAYLEDARELASKIGIPHITYDARDIFKEKIIDYFVNEYLSGRTPVPCTLCNNYFKWPLLAKIADENNISYIATGHYVRKTEIEGCYFIKAGTDKDKDQSFFLWGLDQAIISRMLVPLGEMTKKEVRQFARERGYLKVATKKDSLGVCFCPMDYRTFLKELLPEDEIKKRWFYDENGKILGKHEGHPFFTIGQRRGLGIHLNRPVYVKEIDPVLNKVVLAPLQLLEKKEFFLKEWKTINKNVYSGNERLIIKIRYRKQANTGRIIKTPDHLLQVILDEPVTAVAPGQAAAFYKGELVVGGGIIV